MQTLDQLTDTVDHSSMKLGLVRRTPEERAKTLKFADYAAALKPAPYTWNKYLDVMTDLGSMLNTQIGDCVFAMWGHGVQQWTAASGDQVVIPDATIQALYTAVAGYNPANPATDVGSSTYALFSYLMNNPTGGVSLSAWMDSRVGQGYGVNITNAIYYFGVGFLEVNLPTAAQGQTIWQVTTGPGSSPGSWGAHAVPVIGYDTHYLYFISWGQLMKMTWAWFYEYAFDLSVAVSPSIVNSAGVSPDGFNMTQLMADIKLIGSWSGLDRK